MVAAATPPRFDVLDVNPDNFPAELADRRQFVLWKAVPKQKQDGSWKLDKEPYNVRTGRLAKTNDSSTWGTLAEAIAGLRKYRLSGIGFVFDDQRIFGIDLDKCRDPETGAVEPWAMAIVERFNTYTEPSVSGTGLHLIGIGDLPKGGRKQHPIEVYDDGRFFTMTGQPLPGFERVRDVDDMLATWHAETFTAKALPKTAFTPPPDFVPLTVDEQTVLRRARRTERFRALEAGDSRDYNGDESAADQAFCNALVGAGADRQQVDAIVRQSGRMRDKWDRKHFADGRTYGEATLDTAFDGSIQNRWDSRVIPFPTRGNVAPVETADLPAEFPPAAVTMIAEWRARALAAETRVEELEDEVAQLRDDNTALINVSSNPNLKAEAATFIRTAIEVLDAKRRGDADEEGFVPIKASKIGDDYDNRKDGLELPIRARGTVSRHIKKGAELGLFEREVRTVQAIRVQRDDDGNMVIDPETRKPVTFEAPTQQTYVRMAGDTLAEVLRPFRFFKTPNDDQTDETEMPKTKHGGDRRSAVFQATRTACPDCGSTDRQTFCKGCGSDITEIVESDEIRAYEAATAVTTGTTGQGLTISALRAALDPPPMTHQEHQEALAVYAGLGRTPPDRYTDVRAGRAAS